MCLGIVRILMYTTLSTKQKEWTLRPCTTPHNKSWCKKKDFRKYPSRSYSKVFFTYLSYYYRSEWKHYKRCYTCRYMFIKFFTKPLVPQSLRHSFNSGNPNNYFVPWCLWYLKFMKKLNILVIGGTWFDSEVGISYPFDQRTSGVLVSSPLDCYISTIVKNY